MNLEVRRADRSTWSTASRLRTPAQKTVVLVTVLLGVGSAVGVTALAATADRTFTAVSGPTQSLISITVAFLGVLLVKGIRRPVLPAIVLAVVLAAALALVGAAATAVVLAIAPSTAGHGRWQHVVLIGLGSLLVQTLAQLTGTGFGLLLRSVVVACLATIVFPLGLWLLLGTLPFGTPAQAWLTPYATARHLLSGEMTPLNWFQWAVVVTVWGVGLNAVGAWRASRRSATGASPSPS